MIIPQRDVAKSFLASARERPGSGQVSSLNHRSVIVCERRADRLYVETDAKSSSLPATIMKSSNESHWYRYLPADGGERGGTISQKLGMNQIELD
jgi:hypothetical protein